MGNDMVQAWIIRAGRDDEYEQEALTHGVAALGWRRIGDLTAHSSLAAINSLVDGAYAEFSPRSRQEYGAQLFAFRCRVLVGDYIVLLRGKAPDVAVGTVTGDYAHRPDLPAQHIRPVRWRRMDVRRTEIGADLLTAPALTSIYKINRPNVTARLDELVGAGPKEADAHTKQPPKSAFVAPPLGTPAPMTPMENLQRNLDYALSLATAGLHLQKLKVEAFEVSDVFRAAWVQGVAALDHWVHQEIHVRMLKLATLTPSARTQGVPNFQLPIVLADQVIDGRLTIRQAVARHFMHVFGGMTFQNPDKIREGLANVADVSQLWQRVANVLTERAADDVRFNSEQVRARLREVVFRRNKIAHEYDEDPNNAPNKRPIDAAAATQAIEWIRQVAEGILVVLDNG
jgi:hypothetical protein